MARRCPGGALIRALLLAFLLTGCADEEQGVTLRFWGMGREGEVAGELFRDFERENPGIHVRAQQIPWSAAHEKLLTGFVGGSMPDVSQLGNTWVAEFSALGALEPLDPWIERSTEVDAEGFFPGIWDTNVIDGVVYGVPWYVDTRLLFYRRDLLADAGYERMPESWADWRAALVAIRERSGGASYGVLLPVDEPTQPVILGLQAGSTLLRDHDTRGAFREPAFARGFAFYLDLFQAGLAPPVVNSQIGNLYQEFERGHFAMFITGPWNIGELKRRLPAEMQDDWATAPLPGPTGAIDGVSLAGGSSVVVARGSKHKTEAWKLVEYLSRPDTQRRFQELTGDLPARREVWADSSLALDPNFRAFGEQLARAVPSPKVPEWELITVYVRNWAERAIRGVASPESCLAGLDREVDHVLEKRRWMVARALAERSAR